VLEWIEDRDHFRKVQQERDGSLLLAFWGSFSDAAQRALSELEKFAQQREDTSLYVVDVQKVRGLHKEFGVERVPTVLAIQDGEVSKRIEGVQSAMFYAVHLSGARGHAGTSTAEAGPKRVIVYSGPGCPACGQLKSYLRRHEVAFREVDISRDQHAAQKIARRSGMMAVPQTDIDGRLVVGFDRAKLDRLLAIQSEREDR